MNILTAQQIRAWDQFTILHEPIASIDLMERAARKCVEWICAQPWKNKTFQIFCGKGNNGGDGLAIARMLITAGCDVAVYILEKGSLGTEDFQHNLQRLHKLSTNIHFIQSKENFPSVNTGEIVIDALFGSGLNKPLENIAAELAIHINQSNALVVSIDLPSGLFSDVSSSGNIIVEADHTLTFQCYKTGLLVQENAPFIGEVHLLDIGLHPGFLQTEKFNQELITASLVLGIYKPRNRFAHKGAFGHALLVAGSYGKMGAAVLACRACLHSGVGLLSCCIPKCGYEIMQTSVPEAMVITDVNEEIISQLPYEIEKYTVIGIGPGIGTSAETQKIISFIARRYTKPLVIDADGLNCLAMQKELLQQLPAGSVLTPHPKEFDRLFGEHKNDFDRIATARQKAKELQIVIVLKGHHSLIATPGGYGFFNSTGNAGMAKGGSGDVLTGIITSLIAQKYEPVQAVVMGVYLHGLAGDLAAVRLSQESMTASDIIHSLHEAFRSMRPV